MSRITFDELFKVLSPFIKVGRSTNGKNIFPQEKLLVFLYAAGGNSSISYSGDALGISDGSVRNCVNEIITAFFEVDGNGQNFISKYIRLPTTEEAKANAEEFLKKAKFPKKFPAIFFGAIDGCHIEV